MLTEVGLVRRPVHDQAHQHAPRSGVLGRQDHDRVRAWQIVAEGFAASVSFFGIVWQIIASRRHRVALDLDHPRRNQQVERERTL